MAARSGALGTIIRIATMLIAGLATNAVHAQGMISTPVKGTTATGAPTISGSPGASLVAGTFFDFRPVASDPNGDRLTFSINKLPRWAQFDATTGRLYGTPQTSDVGKIKGVVITVSDGTNRKNSGKGTIKVVAGKAPTIAGSPGTAAKETVAYSFQPTASDPDGQALQYGIINKPTWASFDAATGRLYGTPPKGSAGTYANVGISVTDGANTASLAQFTITVEAVQNAAPKISGTPPATVQVGQVFDFTPAASDADGDALRFAIVNKPSWAAFDANTGRLTGKPATGNEGPYADIVISVSDNQLISFLPPFNLTVQAASTNKTSSNTPPTISGTAPSSVASGAAYAFQPSASDVDGDALTYAASNLPSWLSINATTGRVSGTAPASAGTYTGIVVSVSDGKASTPLPAFTIVVAVANSAPVIAGTPPASVKAGVYFSYKPTITDADGDALTLLISNRPYWTTFDYKTGELYGTPNDVDAGKTFSGIQITAYDGKVSTNAPAFSIKVLANDASNTPPTISGSPATTAKEGVAYIFTPSAADADGNALRFGIANLPSWASFDNVTGRLSGTPAVGKAGVYSNIVISVSDGTDSATLPAFSITVAAAAQQNRAPTISGSPSPTATEGTAWTFQPTASDADGDALTFSASGVPAWLSFNGATGKLTGTPPVGAAGTYSGITVSVSDGQVSTALAPFSITVSAAPNRAPTISGTPATTATEGTAWSFQPTASDADGDTLSFSASGVPAWLSFNGATGKLSGTPAASDVATYSNVVISVSDGKLSATLPAFNIAVKAVVVGSADLTWTAPTQNEDGSALTNLAGYKVRYGTSPGALTQVVTIAGAGITTARIEGLTAGTWYFSVSSYTNTGVESAPAGPVYKLVQ